MTGVQTCALPISGFDWLAPYYRSITACLQFGMTPREILLGSFSKADDPSSGGRQMPNHYGQIDRQILSVSSPVASQLLHAVGIALAARLRGTGQVALTVTGEGSSNQGDVHEGLNFAAIHRLPFIYVVENNGYAISVPTRAELPVGDVAARAAAYGIPGVVVDRTDPVGCYRAAREAVRRARAGDGPTLIEAKVAEGVGRGVMPFSFISLSASKQLQLQCNERHQPRRHLSHHKLPLQHIKKLCRQKKKHQSLSVKLHLLRFVIIGLQF